MDTKWAGDIEKSFSLGMSVPSYQTHFPVFKQSLDQLDTNYFQSVDWEYLIAPWDYYVNMSSAPNKTGTIQDLLDILDTDRKSVEWDLDLLSHLYWDAKILSNLDQYFVFISGQFVDTSGLVLVFVATNGGLTRVYPTSQSQSFEDHRDTVKEAYYRRVIASDEIVFFIDPFSEVQTDNGTDIAPDVTVARAVSMENGNTMYKPAVVGARFNNTKFVDTLIEKTNDSDFFDCGDADNLACYLVDDGGFLIASNQEEHVAQVGKFLGIVDPPVMQRLFNESVYKSEQYFDYQVNHQCDADTKEASAGFASLRVPSINLLFDALSFNWWTSKLTWLYLNYNFWNSWFTSNQVYAEDEEPYEVESCIQSVHLYYYGATTTMGASLDCNNCTRNIMSTRLPRTNLLLVVSDPPCAECSAMYTRLPQEGTRVTEDEEKEVICNMARQPRYRKSTEECYSKDPREDASICGCLSGYTASKLTLVLSFLVIVCVHFMSSHS